MIYFAQAAANQADLVAAEAESAGSQNIKVTTSGVQFTGDLEVGYRFTLTSRIASRLLLALYFDDHINNVDELYERSLQVPWETYIDPTKTFQVTQTVQHCDYLQSAHFAALKIKDAIVDRIKEKFDGERPNVDTEKPDVTFHIHIRGSLLIIYVDFSGEGLFMRGYRSQAVEVGLKEHLASAVLERTEWYKSVKDGAPGLFLDPFCGSGTLAIEAALMARDIAPGLIRKYPYAFEKLWNFDADLFEKVLDELSDKAEVAKERDVKIYASDISRAQIEIAKAAALKAGVYDDIVFDIVDFGDVDPAAYASDRGYIVTDPPYGVRMKNQELGTLYSELGEKLNADFKGWKVAILCGDSSLLSYIDLKPERTNSLYNGGILCQLAHYTIFTEEEKQALIDRAVKRKAERLALALSPGAQMAFNRLKKNLEALKPLMEEQGVTSYRIYDADMPEYAAAIDLYDGTWISLQEYAPPASINKEDAERRLKELVLATERATGIDLENIHVKQRKEQKGDSQYTKLASLGHFNVIRENGVRLLVNFTDYIDTGIFLDHRPIRKYIQEHAEGKRFLNLFCYTGSASLNALKGGALSTVSVDASNTYLDWAMENFRLNGYSTDIGNFFYKADVISWLWDTYDRYDLIFCDPPTYSNGKGRAPFDVQLDQEKLINACMMHLDTNGLLIFSNNYRRFKLSPEIEEKYSVEDISEATIGDDFKRDMKIHKCYLIRNKVKVTMPQKRIIRVNNK